VTVRWNVFRLGDRASVKVETGYTAAWAIRRARELSGASQREYLFAPGLAHPSQSLAEQEVREEANWRAAGCPDRDGIPTKRPSPSKVEGEAPRRLTETAGRATSRGRVCPVLAAPDSGGSRG
jgi:hypothetical protein